MMRQHQDSDLSDVDSVMYQNSMLLHQGYSPYMYNTSRHGSMDATGISSPNAHYSQNLSPVSPLHLPQQPSNGQAGYYISQQGDLVSDRSGSSPPLYGNSYTYSHSPSHAQAGQYFIHSPTASDMMSVPLGANGYMGYMNEK
jgi:hypothetical protein